MCSDDDDELFAGFTAPKGLSGQPSHPHQHPHQKTTTMKIGGSSKKGGSLPSSSTGSGSGSGNGSNGSGSNGNGSGSPPPVVAGRAPTQVMSKGTGIEGYNARPGGSVRYMGGVRGGRDQVADEEEEGEEDDFNAMDDFDMGVDDGDGDDEYSRDKVKSNHHTAAAAAPSSSSSSSSSSSAMHRNDKNAVTGGPVGFGGSGPAVLSSASIHTNNKGSNHSTMSTGHGSNSSQNHNNVAVMASSSTSSSTSTMTSTSRVVMKPGQRPFVRAGGSNSRKPIPPQTTTT